MCLFDVVVALDVKKIEKNGYFVFFYALRHLPIFSDVFAIVADKIQPGPRRNICRHDICNYDFNQLFSIFD